MAVQNGNNLHYAVFMVDDVPYCLWSESDPRELTVEFLNNFQPQYFEYQADTNLKKLRFKKNKQMAAIALRTAYSHGLETLFSLLCASIQAPHCVAGWMLHCNNRQLYLLLRKINDSMPIESLLNTSVNWENISKAIYNSFVISDKKKEEAIKIKFAELWSRWSSDFIKEDFLQEYNSIKHGFRAKAGEKYLGFRSSNSTQSTLLGKSEFGSSFYCHEPIFKPTAFHLIKKTRSWEPEAMAWGLHLISMSIGNIISAIKVINGVPANKVIFTNPTDFDMFSKPWEKSSSFGVSSHSSKLEISVNAVKKFSPDELKKMYREGKVLDGENWVD